VLRISWVNYLEIGGLISILEGGNTGFSHGVVPPQGMGHLGSHDFGIFSGFVGEGNNTYTIKFFCVQIADITHIFEEVLLPAAIDDYCHQQLSADSIVSQDLYLSRSSVRTTRRGFGVSEGTGAGYTSLL